MMRQLKQIYPLLALILITVSPVTSVAEPMENSSDKEDSYFKDLSGGNSRGSSTSLPPRSDLAKTNIFSPSSQGTDTVIGISTATRRPVVFKEDDPMSGIAKTDDWSDPRKVKTFDARSLPHNSEHQNITQSAKVVAENAMKDKKRESPATIESSSFQSGFHKSATANKKNYSGIKSIHTTSKIAASGKGSMDLSKLFKNRLKMRRGPAQHDFNWNEMRGQIGSGPHPIFLGVDQYFHKVRLDYNGEMAN